MRLWLAVAVVLLLGACTQSAPASLVEVHDERGFTLRYPQKWLQVRRDDAVWYVPTDADRVPEAAEFILVVTRSSGGKLDDPAIRRTVFELLPIQGVSGFQQDTRRSRHPANGLRAAADSRGLGIPAGHAHDQSGALVQV